jgi:hypothetical protein
MMGLAAVFLLVGMLTESALAFAIGLVFALIHLDRLNHQSHNDEWDNDDFPGGVV